MERYQQLFTRLESTKEGAFVPFVTLGDPNPTLSLQIIDTLIEAGADALELGIPFSDPLADGPGVSGGIHRSAKELRRPPDGADAVQKPHRRQQHQALSEA